MKRAFVFFTNRINLTCPPVSIMADKIGEFDNNNNVQICIIGKQKELQFINVNENLPEITVQPYYVLIKDSIDLPSLINGKVIGNCKKLQSMLNNYDEIYLVIHNTNPSNCLVTFQYLFTKNLKNEIYQSHIENSIYYRILRRALNDEGTTNLLLLEDEIIKEFPNSRLESLIHLYKFLKLVPLKLQENWTEEEFKKNTDALKNSNKIKSAKDIFERFSFKENFTEYYTQIESIENEIIELSKTS